jgi:putative transcriptional regulator
LAFAGGQADLPLRVLVEIHLATCPACAAVVAELRAPGGALLAGLPGGTAPPGLWERLSARLDGEVRPAPAALLPGLILPPGAVAELPGGPAPRWRHAWGLGGEMALVAEDAGTGSRLLAGRMRAGRRFPRHQHTGPEDLVVLAGGYDDHLGTYEVGDYAAYAPGTVHEPATDADEGCAILVRLETPNRFFGWRGVLQRIFT